MMIKTNQLDLSGSDKHSQLCLFNSTILLAECLDSIKMLLQFSVFSIWYMLL